MWVREQGKPVSGYDLAQGLGIGKVTALDYLKQLGAAGELTQHTQGRTFVFAPPDTSGHPDPSEARMILSFRRSNERFKWAT